MIDGTEYGPRIAEIGNWTGKAIYSNRASIHRIMARPEMDNPGVYFLKSSPSKSSFAERIYIGEGENIGNRLNQQLADATKDFEEVVFFTSKDDFLTKAHIKYLEARLIGLAKAAKTAEIANVNIPSLPVLHEADVSDMEYFLDQIKLILPIMGFRFLVETVITETGGGKVSTNVYTIKSPVLKARMYESEQGFIVMRGSQANRNMAPSLSETYKTLHQKLIDSGILQLNGKSLKFTEDTVFSSPSAAANLVLGRQTPGPLFWIDEKGRSFKEVTDGPTIRQIGT